MATEAKTREGSILAVVIDETARQIMFNVRGAAPDGGGKSITLDLGAVSQANLDYAALHGFKQRIGDMAAQSKNPKTGLPASPADKFEAIERGVQHYMSGSPDWNMRSASGERVSGEFTLLVRALVQFKAQTRKPMTADEARDWLKLKSKAEQATLALSDSLKPLIDGYRAEVAADIDADEMLAELE